MSNETVLFEVDGAIATLTLNRPQALNALDVAMVDALRDATERLETDDRIRVAVLRGAGAHFMAGGDIKWFHGMLDTPPAEKQVRFERLIEAVQGSVMRLRRTGKPVIASVHGAVAGFGLSLMNACDLAVAADDAYFTLAYCHIGVTPDGGATYTLPRLVGQKLAMEIALLGDRFTAQRALELGLVNRVVPAAELAAATQKLAERLAAGPTAVYAGTKRLINDALNRSLPEQLLAEQESFAASTLTADFTEGVSAFVEKRKPAFSGR